MLLDATATALPYGSERAKADSLTLWQSLIMLPVESNLDGGPSLAVNAAERCALDLAGRYHFGDGEEFAGQLSEISPRGLRLKGPRIASPGARCFANIASVGIVEGLAVEGNRDSFVLALVAPQRRLRRLAKRLNWQLRRINNDDVIEKRSSERVEMNDAQATIETLAGQTFPCAILDLSNDGAALKLDASAIFFWVGQPVKLDGRRAQVVRYFSGGVAIKFD